jgi:hypothetical protein
MFSEILPTIGLMCTFGVWTIESKKQHCRFRLARQPTHTPPTLQWNHTYHFAILKDDGSLFILVLERRHVQFPR